MSTAIEIRGLKKVYGGFRRKHWALRDVDLVIPRGTTFGLIGPNGAGKTTLVKTLLSVVRPSEGTIRVLDGDPEDPAVRRRVGYLPERLHFAPGVTARSFLRNVAAIRRVANSGVEVSRQIGRVGLVSDGDRPVSGFSKGMRQRLGLAAALLGNPDLLILDEPTDGIDPIGRAAVRSILQEESARGATVLMNSHLLEENERSCERIGILVDGRIVEEGSIEKLSQLENRWALKFSQADDEQLVALGFTKGDDSRWFFSAGDPEQLNAAIDAARRTGAQLMGLAPHVRSLEDILKAAVTKDDVK